MILTTKTTKTEFFKKVMEYYTAHGIPADETGRTDGRVGIDGSIISGLDNKLLVETEEGYALLLHKGVIKNRFGFDMKLKNFQRLCGRACFISENQIDINISNVEVLYILSQYVPKLV